MRITTWPLRLIGHAAFLFLALVGWPLILGLLLCLAVAERFDDHGDTAATFGTMLVGCALGLAGLAGWFWLIGRAI